LWYYDCIERDSNPVGAVKAEEQTM
jgi:hypothetical protein